MTDYLPHRADASTEETRAVAERMVAALCGHGSSEGLFDGMALWVAGSSWWSGDLSPERAASVQAQFHRCLRGGKDGLAHDVHSIIADGNKAAVEMRISGTWYDGRHFSKDLHVAIDVEGGRIVSYREYGFDDAFFALEPEGRDPLAGSSA